MKNKYYSQKVTYDGHTFDSKKEMQRYYELKLMERAGVISDLKLQVPFELIPSQYINKKCVERGVNYIADFVYTEGGKMIVEDVKGYKKGQAYAIFSVKRKLMLYIHGIRIKEV